MENIEQEMNQNNTEDAVESKALESTKKSALNGVLPITIILILIVAGGVYAFMKVKSQNQMNATQNNQNATTSQTDNIVKPESTSTAPADIEKDLNMTDINSLDKTLQDLNNI